MISSGAVKEETDRESLDAQPVVYTQVPYLIKSFLDEFLYVLGNVESHIERSKEDGVKDKDRDGD